jgi:hypothetical protein
VFPEEKATNKWIVRGLVVGSKLPKNAIKFKRSCIIKRITESERVAHLQRAANLRADPLGTMRSQLGEVGALSCSLPILYAESQHELSITTVATNPPLAANKATEEADKYLAL